MSRAGFPVALVLAAVAVFASTGTAAAHGFGERYDLPVPLRLYLAGAAATVAISFVVIGLFVKAGSSGRRYPRYNLFQHRVAAQVLQHPVLLAGVRTLSVALFLLVVVAGFAGGQDPNANLAPTFVWVIWWVGFGFAVAFVGNFWPLINPWNASYGAAERTWRQLSGGRGLSFGLRYPERLGLWPALVLFIAFAWVENVYGDSSVPRHIAAFAIAYSLLTWTGMALFGRHRWLRNGEAFSVLYDLWGRFAPTEVRVVGREVHGECGSYCQPGQQECVNCYECFERAPPAARELNVRPFAAGLPFEQPAGWDRLAFVIFSLAIVTFDGFESTRTWGSLVVSSYEAFEGLGGLTTIGTIGLIAFSAIFLAVYLLFAYVMAAAAGSGPNPGQMARGLVYSLIPIALAYNVAHFYSFLTIQGQGILSIASDPFAWDWNLFGTAEWRINIGIVSAKFTWFLSVAVIVLGHMIAVYLAHTVALRLIKDEVAALRSQFPMLLLMVVYTVTSLWIIAQPIVTDS